MVSRDLGCFNIEELSNYPCRHVPVTIYDWIFNLICGLDLRHANVCIHDFRVCSGVVTSVLYVGLHSSGSFCTSFDP